MKTVKDHLIELKNIVEARPGVYTYKYFQDKFGISWQTIRNFCEQNGLSLKTCSKKTKKNKVSEVREGYFDYDYKKNPIF